MKSIGSTIKCLRKAMGVTQDEMAQSLGVTYQAVSKWENDTTQPDIMLIPALATYFGVSIDELFGYKLKVMTDKERLIDFMAKNQILCKGNFELKNGGISNYYINTEQFTTNAQISKIGEVFADCIRENNIQFDTIVGLAYHGIGFSTATAVALHNKYGMTTQFCYDRKVPDSRERWICGHTLQDGEKIIIIDDVITTGRSIEERINRLKEQANIEIAAVIVIINRCNQAEKSLGVSMLEEKYGAKVYSLITDEDIRMAHKNGIISL